MSNVRIRCLFTRVARRGADPSIYRKSKVELNGINCCARYLSNCHCHCHCHFWLSRLISANEYKLDNVDS